MPTALSTLAIASAVFVLLYLRFYWPRRKQIFDFDPGERKGEFEPHAERYQSLSKLVLTLASASTAYLVNFLVNLDGTKPRTSYSLRLEAVAPTALTLLCLSAGSCLGFLLLENLYYEDYVHSKYPSEGIAPRETYTGARYATILMLSGTGLVFFVLAYVIVATWLFF